MHSAGGTRKRPLSMNPTFKKMPFLPQDLIPVCVLTIKMKFTETCTVERIKLVTGIILN